MLSEPNIKHLLKMIEQRSQVELYTWSTKYRTWSAWSFANALLKNLPGCTFGKNCPLQPGPLTINAPVANPR